MPHMYVAPRNHSVCAWETHSIPQRANSPKPQNIICRSVSLTLSTKWIGNRVCADPWMGLSVPKCPGRRKWNSHSGGDSGKVRRLCESTIWSTVIRLAADTMRFKENVSGCSEKKCASQKIPNGEPLGGESTTPRYWCPPGRKRPITDS